MPSRNASLFAGLCLAFLVTACSSPPVENDAPVQAPVPPVNAPTPDLISEAAGASDLIADAAGTAGEADLAPATDPAIAAAIANVLTAFGEGCVTADAEAAMATVSEDFSMGTATSVMDKSALRSALIEQLVYGSDPATGYELADLRVNAEGFRATAEPFVLKRASGANVWFEFELRQEFGEWRILSFSTTTGLD